MSLRINTNTSALNALRHLESSQMGLTDAIGRLSSGLRINKASDDPAGLIISEGMRAQLKGIDQAIRNSQDAVNMAKTAESSLDEVSRLLRDIRGLAVHSSNSAVVDAATLQANQTQIRSTIQSINRIAEQTAFGTKKLLNGSAGVLANVTSINDVSSIYLGGTFAGESITSGPITLSRVTEGDKAQVSLGRTFAATTTAIGSNGTFVINGYAFSVNASDTLDSVIGRINEVSNTTGVTAARVGTAGSYTIELTQNNFGAQNRVEFFDASNLIHNAASAQDIGTDAVFNVSVTTQAGVTSVAFTGGRSAGESGLKLRDNYGNIVVMTEIGNATITGLAQAVGQVTAGNVRFQIGANPDEGTQFTMPAVFANRLGQNAVAGMTLADIDVTTFQGAQDAMRIIEDAIQQVGQMRGELGSFQKNFLESTVRSLGIAQENLISTESQIRDADMAQEVANMTRFQILQQSGMAALAQANQIPQGILQLLRG